ncbi:hypothetical protein [Labilibaculum euxinus]
MWNVRMNTNFFNSTGKITALFVLGLLLITSNAFSQNNTSSPYSYFGLGERMQNMNGNSAAMGGVSYGYKRGDVLNLSNPASLSSIDSLKFHFNIGTTFKFSKLNQGDKSDHFNDFNLSRIAFGFKVSHRYGTALSISPYSSLGYDITKRDNIYGNSGSVIRSLLGSGGLNQFVWSNGVQLSKDLSLGVNGIYLFGNNTRSEDVVIEGGASTVYSGKTELISKGLYFNLALQYERTFGDYKINFGGMYQPNISVDAKKTTSVYVSNSSASRFEDEDRGTFDVPESFGVGFGLNKGKHLWFGGDYTHEKWSGTRIFDEATDLVNRDKFSLGMEYNANDGYARKFIKKMTYRMGGFYDTGYIKVGGNNIDSYGLSLGLGIPMAQQKGMLNIAVEFGSTGTLNNNMVREDYTRVTIDFNLFETWFVKRKYQ